MPPDSAPIPLKAPPARRRRRPASKNGGGPDGNGRPPREAKPKLKKLRLFLIAIPLIFLAIVSLVFGMLISVAAQLDSLENESELQAAEKSVLIDTEGDPLATLTGNQNRILLKEPEISPMLKNAVIAIEDRRYWEHEGVDYKGIARALWADIRQGEAVQGGSTITQQFVKNALSAQGDRSVFQKLRESAFAYHLERKWSKQKILTQYLNSVYFGNGAYGIESAMRTYFGDGQTEYDPDERAARSAEPHEAALLAGMIASPDAYNPLQNPRAAKERRDLVLDRMRDQGMITETEYQEAIVQAPPSEEDVHPPQPDSDQPYFTTWVTQQLVDRYGSGVAFGGGLEVETTIDREMQEAAEQAIQGRIGGYGGMTASMAVIENKTAEVKAIVGGFDFKEKPFNLATNGHRQPGSAIKPFTLATALDQGVAGPGSTFVSEPKRFPVRIDGKRDIFAVENYEGSYSGVITLASATARSDNSVYAELGMRVGTKKIARMAERMGIQTELSTNPAMTLGGLEEGVTPLEMAYAYSTIANKGQRVSGSLSASGGPVAIEKVQGVGDDDVKNEKETTRVFSEQTGNTMHSLLGSVVTSGTGTKAAIGEFAAGKTGTTENYGDAWFCGFNDTYTACIWVGYPDKLQYMETEYHGQPVAGGTFPAEIWHDFMTSAIAIDEARETEDEDDDDEVPLPTTPAPTTPAPESEAPAETPEETPDRPQRQPQPRQPQPREPQPPREPSPPPAAPPEGEGGGSPVPQGVNE